MKLEEGKNVHLSDALTQDLLISDRSFRVRVDKDNPEMGLCAGYGFGGVLVEQKSFVLLDGDMELIKSGNPASILERLGFK